MNYKQILLFFLFLLYTVQTSNAYPLINIPWTGNEAQLIDDRYYAVGFGGGASPQFGGQAGLNIGGHAFEFTIQYNIYVDHALIDATLLDMGTCSTPNQNQSCKSQFRAIIYDQSIDDPYRGIIPNDTPDIRSEITTIRGLGIHYNVQSKLIGITLLPGTYWIAIEGEGERTSFDNIRLSGRRVLVPEPSACVLLLGGLTLLEILMLKKIGLYHPIANKKSRVRYHCMR